MSEPIVRIDIFKVGTSKIPRAVGLMGTQRRSLKRDPEILFWKLLGTGSGKTFTSRDADPHHWAVLTVWRDEASAANFANSAIVGHWQKIQIEHGYFIMSALSAKGTWAKLSPFGDPIATKWNGTTAALTRAAIKPRYWREFWRSVPPVSADLNQTAGLIASLGIGEAPVGLQGTFSLWQNNESITQFASKQAPHQEVIRKTHETGWYSEELFARFKVIESGGSFNKIDLSSL
jgi:heme-degrading monooxygenase HmoA